MADVKPFQEGALVFEKERNIVISGDINAAVESAVCRALKIFSSRNKKGVTIYLDSFGGGIRSGQHLFDLIRFSKMPIHGVVMTKADSAAFVILQACQYRVAYPNAHVMNHGPGLVGLRIDQPDLEARLEELRKMNEDFLQHLRRRAKVSLKQLRQWCREETELNAHQALEAGLVDEIYTPR